MLYVLLTLSLILCCVAAAQSAPIPPAAITAPALPPLPPNPVETFRKILAMRPLEREKFLATLKPENRQVVELKLDEYRKLSTAEREARLRALQVRVAVRQIIRLPASNRVERLAQLIPAERALVEARLAEWDQLPADLQKEVLANEFAIRRIASSPDAPRFTPPLPIVTQIEKQVQEWRSLPVARRTEILDQFQRFFEEVPESDRSKIMAVRPELAKLPAINQFNQLASREDRERYLANFKKFTSLTPAERYAFMLNARQWEKMSPQQRDAWRVMARKLSSAAPPPPLPPGRPSASLPVPAGEHAALDSNDISSR